MSTQKDDINSLIKGYQKFRTTYLDKNSALFDELVHGGQRPNTLVIACSDSRVDPAIILSAKPGDLFVIRNVANLVPPQENSLDSYHGTSAALQFGVTNLNVKTIIIIGHSQCGGIQALLDKGSTLTTSKPHSFIDKWMEVAMPAYAQLKQHQASSDEEALLCGKYSLINSLNNIHTFSWIEERVTAGTLAVHAWYFNLAERSMDIYDPATQTWSSL